MPSPFGVAFKEMRKSDLLRIDHDGRVLEGGPVKLVNRAAVLIHVAVHEARPDVNCAAHAHAIHGRALSALRMPLLTLSQDSCAFHNDVALFNQFEGVVVDGDEGRHIAEAMGTKKAIFLANHGILTASDTIEATVFWFVSFNKLCKIQLDLMAAVGGDISRLYQIDPDVARKYGARIVSCSSLRVLTDDRTYANIGTPAAGWFSAKPLFDEVAVATNEAYLA